MFHYVLYVVRYLEMFLVLDKREWMIRSWSYEFFMYSGLSPNGDWNILDRAKKFLLNFLSARSPPGISHNNSFSPSKFQLIHFVVQFIYLLWFSMYLVYFEKDPTKFMLFHILLRSCWCLGIWSFFSVHTQILIYLGQISQQWILRNSG